MNKKKSSASSEKQVNKPVPSPEEGSTGQVKKEVPSPKPYSKSERRKNRIKLEENSIYNAYDSKEALDEEAEAMLRQPVREYDDEEEEPLPPAKEPISPKRRRYRRIIFYAVTVAAALVFCALLSLTVFFKIDDIAVEGVTRYSQEEIIEASLLHKDDNLILCSTSPGEEKIVSEFPYIEKADIRKKLFNKIVIQITEARPTSVVEHKGRYYVLSENGKIIEIDKKKLYSVPSILGAKLKNEKLCAYAEYEDDNIKRYINEIMEKVGQYKLKDIETIDITSPTNIRLIRQNGFRILLGSPENLDGKFKTIMEVMEKDVSSDDTGELDVSLCDAAGGRSYLKSNVPEESRQESSAPQPSQPQESSKQEESSKPQESEESEESEEINEEESFDEESSEEENDEEESFDEESSEEYTDEEEESEYTEENEDEYGEDSEETYDEYDEENEDESDDAGNEPLYDDNETEDDGGDEYYTDENDTEEWAE